MAFGRYFYELSLCVVILLSGTYAEDQCGVDSESFTFQMSAGDNLADKLRKHPKLLEYIHTLKETGQSGHIQIRVGEIPAEEKTGRLTPQPTISKPISDLTTAELSFSTTVPNTVTSTTNVVSFQSTPTTHLSTTDDGMVQSTKTPASTLGSTKVDSPGTTTSSFVGTASSSSTVPSADVTSSSSTVSTNPSVDTASTGYPQSTFSTNSTEQDLVPGHADCFKMLLKSNINTIQKQNITQQNYTGNSTVGNYTITFVDTNAQTVDETEYSIINFCVTWEDSSADVIGNDLHEVQLRIKEILGEELHFVGRLVPKDWNMWRFSSNHYPAWYKIYIQKKTRYSAHSICHKNHGNPASYIIRMSNKSHWESLLSNYSSQTFWTGLNYSNSPRSHIEAYGGYLSDSSHNKSYDENNLTEEFLKIKDGTLLFTNESETYFICEAVRIRKHCFKILTKMQKPDEDLTMSFLDTFQPGVTINDIKWIPTQWNNISIIEFNTRTAAKKTKKWAERIDSQLVFNETANFIGKPVPCDWKLWNDTSFPLWYNVFKDLKNYSDYKSLCEGGDGFLPPISWKEFNWAEMLKNYTDGVRFWNNNSSYTTLYPNGTINKEKASHFLCVSVPLNQYCFQVLTNETNADAILQYIKDNNDSEYFVGNNHEKVEINGSYDIFKYIIYTAHTNDQFWEELVDFWKRPFFENKTLGRPVPCDWDLWTIGAFAWYKNFNDSVLYDKANQTCVKYNGRLATVIISDSDEWKSELWPGRDYWIGFNHGNKKGGLNSGDTDCKEDDYSCEKNKAFVCESELASVQQSMQIVVNSSNFNARNVSFLVENLWKTWSDQKYLVYIKPGNFSLEGNHRIFKFNVFASGDDDIAVYRELVTAFNKSHGDDHTPFETNPALDDWHLWNNVSPPVWYKRFEERKNYTNARMKCEEFGARLPAKIIRGNLEHNWSNVWNISKAYWVGLDKISGGDLQWSDNIAYNESETPWKNGEPNQDDNNKHCVRMNANGLKKIECDETKKYICESD